MLVHQGQAKFKSKYRSRKYRDSNQIHFLYSAEAEGILLEDALLGFSL